MVTIGSAEFLITADASPAVRELGKFETQSRGLSSKLGGVFSGITAGIGGVVKGFGALGLAAAGVSSVIDGLKGVGSALGLGALNEMEQTRASFNAFTKDAGQTEKIMAQVREEAAKTPFAFGELAKATASLMPVAKSSGAALMDLVKEAEILAASNPLEGLEGASFSLREAMTGDFTSIIERFNLSRSTINKLKEEGVPNLEIVRRAMQEMGFDSDLIAAKAETLEGRWSTFLDTMTTLQTKIGQPIFDALKEGLVGLQGTLEANMPLLEGLADTMAGGLKSGIETAKTALSGLADIFTRVFSGDLAGAGSLVKTALENIGTTIVTSVEGWASSFAAWVDGAEGDMLGELGTMLTGLFDWLQKAQIGIIGKLAEWAAAFVEWVGPKIPDLLRQLGVLLASLTGWLLGTALPRIVTTLAQWGLELVAWVAPRIPPLLVELGKLLLELGGWIITTALPAIGAKLLEWGDAFTAWVIPMIPKLIVQLVVLQARLIAWIGEQVAGIGKALLSWAGAFLAWVADDVLPKLPTSLGAIMRAVAGWVAEKTAAFVTEAGKLGAGFVKGIRDGIAGALGGFWSWLQTSFVDEIPAFVRELLNIHSPSGVFADIGRNIVDGLRVGMEGRLPTIDEVVSRLVGRISGMSGAVNEWLAAAAAVAGVGADWLPGLSRLAHLESTGNPRAVNDIAVGNEHASGLMQTLPSTFRAYAFPGMGDIFDPIHNAAASIAYIKDQYGHVNNIPGLLDGQKFRGYADGGIAWRKELAWVAEREPELIVPLSKIGGAGLIDRSSLVGPMPQRNSAAVGASLSAMAAPSGGGPTQVNHWTVNNVNGSAEVARQIERAQHRKDMLRGVATLGRRR